MSMKDDLLMRTLKYAVREYEGLVRFFHEERKVPYKYIKKYQINGKNIVSGKVFKHPKTGELIQKEYAMKGMKTFSIQWNEQDHWAWDAREGSVYRIKMQDLKEVNRTKCGWAAPGTAPRAVLARILDRDITINDAYNSEDRHRRPAEHIGADTRTLYKFSEEFDGKSIVVLCIVKPKMTYAEIVNVIVNEGGSVDSQGIVHKA